jgi:hypothetical protein
MSKYSKQVIIYCVALICYVVINASIWHLYTHRLFNAQYHVGDLARLSYLVEYAQPRQEKNTLPKRQIFYEQWQGEPIDLITMGDSFSSGGGLGTNNYYQDWLATHHGLNVMNLPQLTSRMSNIETIYVLLNSGFLDEISPKAVLLEDIGREVIKEHGRQVRIQHWPISQVKSVYAPKPTPQIPSYSFLNSSNAKFIINKLLYFFDDNAFFSQVYRGNLSGSHFSHKQDNTLLFYFEDIENTGLINDRSIERVTQNLNTLAVALSKKDIHLYYMPVVDKLALYHSRIQKPPYPKSALFEKLKEHPRKYHLIDTETILNTAINEGEKDLFYLDDTHWTWRACKRISKAFIFPPLPLLDHDGESLNIAKQKNIPTEDKHTPNP